MFEIEQIRWLVKSTVERAVLCGIRNLAFIMETDCFSCEAGTES